MDKLRIVFMGTPDFAVASLKALVDGGYNVVGVVTAADKPAGRGQQLHQSAVKKYAVEKGLKLLQPEKLKDEIFINELHKLKADLNLVVAFRMLPEVVWNMPPLGTYNLHASLLPKYRGAAPINWAIINGDNETGVTTFKLKHQIDTGNILRFKKVSISATITAGELHDELMKVGAELLLSTVNDIEQSVRDNKQLVFIEQNNSEASHAPKIFRDTCKINWKSRVEQIHNLIRGLSPYPASFTELTGSGGKTQAIKLFVSEPYVFEHAEECGRIETDNKTYLRVMCLGGYIEVKELQMEGKKRMNIGEYLKGFNFKEDSIFV